MITFRSSWVIKSKNLITLKKNHAFYLPERIEFVIVHMVGARSVPSFDTRVFSVGERWLGGRIFLEQCDRIPIPFTPKYRFVDDILVVFELLERTIHQPSVQFNVHSGVREIPIDHLREKCGLRDGRGEGRGSYVFVRGRMARSPNLVRVGGGYSRLFDAGVYLRRRETVVLFGHDNFVAFMHTAFVVGGKPYGGVSEE